VPVENSWRWAREARASLHVVDSDHRMSDVVAEIGHQFTHFLRSLP
jgi:hypothetical protein